MDLHYGWWDNVTFNASAPNDPAASPLTATGGALGAGHEDQAS